MEAYRAAKGLLFRQCERAVVNLDDRGAGRYYAATALSLLHLFGRNKDSADRRPSVSGFFRDMWV